MRLAYSCLVSCDHRFWELVQLIQVSKQLEIYQLTVTGGITIGLMLSSGGRTVLKHFWKNELSTLALSMLVLAETLPSTRFGIEELVLLRDLIAFQNCLVFEGSMPVKYSFLASLIAETTLFLRFLYWACVTSLLCLYALLKVAFLLRMN